MANRKLCIFIAGSVFAVLQLFAANGYSSDGNGYNKRKIADARFGTDAVEAFINLASQVAEKINSRIYGQEIAAQILEDRLLQYGESFGTRKGQPIALNLIGLPGIGKTGMLELLKEMGFPIVSFNAQDFVNPEKDFSSEFRYRIAEFEGRPVIVVIDELDKLPEIADNGVTREEKTNSLIGTLNQILSEGTLPSSYRAPFDVSNVMLVTTMNFSPKEMELFSAEVLTTHKSFYDFDLADFEQFDSWLRDKPSSTYKVLANLFRPNTVGRLAPNTVMLRPLSQEVHRRIVKLALDQSISAASSSDDASQKRIHVTYDDAVLDYIVERAVYAPAGARQTIVRTKALAEQMIRFGVHLSAPGEDPLVDRPRDIHLEIAGGKAIVSVTPKLQASGGLRPSSTFKVALEYDRSAQLFTQPAGLVNAKPSYPSQKGSAPQRPVTKKAIQAARFPTAARIGANVAAAINHELLGQDEAVNLVLDDMRRYLGRPGPATKEPSGRTLSGFPGIGKSELVRLVGEQLKLPIVKINMQQFSSDSPETAKQFLTTLESKIAEAREKAAELQGENGTGPKFIVLLEELDKVFEISPDNGTFVNRPIMAFVKDLLNDGRVSVASSEYSEFNIDIRDAFTFITMNFAVDRFGFEADPRMTTIEDVLNAWKSLNGTPTTIKKLLGSMFLPETVSRLLARFMIMRPLERPDFEELIERQVKKVVDSRLVTNGQNVGQIEIKLTPAYKEYLFNETVIPSEGARHTVVSVQGKIASDLEAALASIPRNGKYATAPLTLTLDFKYAQSAVIARVNTRTALSEKATPSSTRGEVILTHPIDLVFPPSQMSGRLEPDRLFTAAHEFGHAYIALRLGLRIEQIVSVPPEPGIGGYVKFAQSFQSAEEIVSNVYSSLASRALERIFSSPNPEDKASVLAITSGPSSDIQQATIGLFNALYELGFDPDGGTVDRNFIKGISKYADYASMPPQLAEKLGLILRDLEAFMVRELQAAHTQKWYVDKIVKVAQAGAMNEKQFFDLVGYYYPGVASAEEGHRVPAHFREVFKSYLIPEPKRITRAHQQKLAGQPMSINDSINLYMEEFARLIKLHLHGDLVTPPPEPPKAAEAEMRNPIGFHIPAPKKGDCNSLLTDK